MIKDSNRKTAATRKAQQPTDNHHHHHSHHLPHHPQLRAASWHHNYQNHHHHLHHRSSPHVDQQQRHLHQLQHHHNAHERHHQQRRQHGHPRHPHHLVGYDLVDAARAEVVPQQPHSHQRHHLRLQNNSQYPLGLQQQRQDSQNLQSQQHHQAGSEPQPQRPEATEQTTDQIKLEPQGEHNHLLANKPAAVVPNQRSASDFEKGSVHRERLLHPHCRNLLRGVLRTRSATPPGSRNPAFFSSQNIAFDLDVDEKKSFEKTALRNAFSLPLSNYQDSSCLSCKTDSCVNVASVNFDERNPDTDKTYTDSSHPSTTNADDNSAINNHNVTDYNGSITAIASTPDSDAMHLPLHTRLPDGCHVTVNSATERQVSQMYALIQAAAALGEGYGVDEYPTEDDFRQEIKGGHTFVVTAREALQGEDLEDVELDDDEEEDNDDEDEDEDGGIVREEAGTTGHLIAAFSLATSRFYRGNDVKVADPIVIVKREERGKGIGEFVFRLAVQFSRRMGFAGIYTDTFCNNTAMMRIIERHPGFKLVGYLPLGGKMPDGTTVGANIYFKDLRSSNDESSGFNS